MVHISLVALGCAARNPVALFSKRILIGKNALVSTPYRILSIVQGSPGTPKVALGKKGLCRFCGETDLKRFRKIAHTFPEALGNKWITSLDECDICNHLFSPYEDAIAKAVSPILTVGGTLGKGNKVRQTGRSAGNSVINHSRRTDGKRHLSFFTKVDDLKRFGTANLTTGCLQLDMPIAGVPFVPRLAYKALVKMGLSILPVEELQNFQGLLDWIRHPEREVNFARLNVGLSFGSIGNAPPLAVGAAVKRTDIDSNWPYMFFFFCAGSVCFQIDLKSDRFDGEWPPLGPKSISLKWTNVLADNEGNNGIRIEYGEPIQFDWSSSTSKPQPVEKLILIFDPRTQHGSMTPIMRQ